MNYDRLGRDRASVSVSSRLTGEASEGERERGRARARIRTRRDGTPTHGRDGKKGAVPRRETLHTRVHIRRFSLWMQNGRPTRKRKRRSRGRDATAYMGRRRDAGSGRHAGHRAKNIWRENSPVLRVVRALSTAQFTGQKALSSGRDVTRTARARDGSRRRRGQMRAR